MTNKLQLQKAIDKLYLVRERLITKLGSSTTSAQAHLGLLDSCAADIKVAEDLMTLLCTATAEPKAPARKFKTKTSDEG